MDVFHQMTRLRMHEPGQEQEAKGTFYHDNYFKPFSKRQED